MHFSILLTDQDKRQMYELNHVNALLQLTQTNTEIF